jgi:hypothetical protein
MARRGNDARRIQVVRGQAQQRQHRRRDAHRQPLAPGRLAPLRPPLELALGGEERAVRVARGRAGRPSRQGLEHSPDLARQPGEDQHEQERARVLLEVIHRERAEGTGRCRVRNDRQSVRDNDENSTRPRRSGRLARDETDAREKTFHTLQQHSQFLRCRQEFSPETF